MITRTNNETYIHLSHNNQIKKVQWKSTLSATDFNYLVKSLYKFGGKLIGLQDSHGNKKKSHK